MSVSKPILICRCAERGLLSDVALEPLLSRSDVTVVEDLCKSAVEKDPLLAEISAQDAPVIYACHPRAVRALFQFAENPLPQSAEVINLREKGSHPTPKPTMATAPAWYPVIDADRCSQCGQCFEFCLFGVYEKTADGHVSVVNPTSCKNNCPACARICPDAAIIFPKAGEEPINGAPISDEEALRSNIKVNVDEILGDDVYAALNARKKKRRSLLNKKKVEQALEERRKCSEDKQK